MSCIDIFKPYIDGGDLDYSQFSEDHPNCVCETEICSEHSSGPVSNGEDVVCLLTSGRGYDPHRNQLLPDAFTELFKRDLSIIRHSHATQQEVSKTRKELLARAEAKNPPETRIVDKIWMAPAIAIRSIKYRERQAIGVYDTAFQDRKCHASAVLEFDFKDQPRSDRLARKEIRAALVNLLNEKMADYETWLEALSPKG